MSLPQYSRYKDSGVEWLGFIPEHWHFGRLKNSVLSSKGGIWGSEESFDDNDIVCVRVADFDRSKLRVALENPTIRNVLQSERNGRILERGDLLLEKSGGGENQLVGCVVLYEHDEQAVCSNFVARLKLAADMVSEYWCYVHFALYALRVNYCSINQTSGIQNLDQDKYLNEIVPYPDFSEQSVIATFLDRETAIIDALILEQEKLIALLAEKRQATISHAVTKGLNPHAPLKESGVEWLGEVPEHWTVNRIKHLTATFEQGWSPQCEGYPVESEREWGVLKVGCVNGGVFRPEENKALPIELDALPNLSITKGDLLISRANTRELVGSAAVALQNYPNLMLCDKLFRARFAPDTCEPIFVAHFLGTCMARSQIELAASGASSSMVNIGQSTILELDVAVPTLTEQQKIVKFLDDETERLDNLAVQAKRGIALLQERRSALISAAVTGKIDVRQAVQQEQITIREAA